MSFQCTQVPVPSGLTCNQFPTTVSGFQNIGTPGLGGLFVIFPSQYCGMAPPVIFCGSGTNKFTVDVVQVSAPYFSTSQNQIIGPPLTTWISGIPMYLTYQQNIQPIQTLGPEISGLKVYKCDTRTAFPSNLQYDSFHLSFPTSNGNFSQNYQFLAQNGKPLFFGTNPRTPNLYSFDYTIYFVECHPNVLKSPAHIFDVYVLMNNFVAQNNHRMTGQFFYYQNQFSISCPIIFRDVFSDGTNAQNLGGALNPPPYQNVIQNNRGLVFFTCSNFIQVRNVHW